MNFEFYLVKLPKFVAEEWDKMANGNKTGGIVVLGDIQNNILSVESNTKLPPKYKIMPRPSFAPMLVFSSNSASQDPRLDGAVTQFADVSPVLDNSYQSLLKHRLISDSTNHRSTEYTTTDNIETFQQESATMRQAAIDRRQVKRKRVVRVKMDKRLLQKRIQDMFNKQDSYSFKEIQRRTDQPPRYLRTVLKELCEEKERKFSLKPEFKLITVQPIEVE